MTMPTKILVVDDSAADRLIIAKMLKDYCVLLASDGLEAMRQIDEHGDIDLLILDLKMPHMDGFQVLEAIRSDPKYERLRTIILTNYNELENEIRGLQMGAVDYIRKPVQMHSLRARIAVHDQLLQIQRILEQRLEEQKSALDTVCAQAAVGVALFHGCDAAYAKSGWAQAENDAALAIDGAAEAEAIQGKAYISMNPMFEQITGRTRDELVELGWASITHPDDLQEDLARYDRYMSGEINGYTIDKRLVRPDGSVVWVQCIMTRLAPSSDDQPTHLCLIHDITERKKMEEALIESERSKSVLLSHLPGLAYRCSNDEDWTMHYVSAGCLALTGYHAESLLENRDLSYNDLIAPEYREALRTEWQRILAARLPFRSEYEIITASGDRKWVLEMGEGVYGPTGEVEALEGLVIDITDRKTVESTLKYNSEHDRLTGLYNQSYLESVLNRDAKRHAAGKRAVVGINLSPVQALSMIYGLRYAQDLIKEISRALSTHATDKRTLFRIDDNHLVFYLTDYSDKSELIDFCETVASTLESSLASERVGGGIGVLEIDQDNERDVDRILTNLLVASESAMDILDRDIGIRYYDATIEERATREQEIRQELDRVATDEEDGGLYLQYQPILDLRSSRICGFEALARLRSEKLGLVPPLEFIPIAEKTRLIIPVGRKVLVQALRFLRKLKDNGYPGIIVSVNVSVIQVLRKDFCTDLLGLISEAQVRPGDVSIEITESAFAWNLQEINRIFSGLRAAGVHISIDDFGTGYSSLARERELNVNCLKIAKPFVDKLMHLKPEESITGHVISMAHRLGHYVIAEGVEHERQRQCLMDYGCDKIQGYLISRPVDEDVAIGLLKRWGGRHDDRAESR